MLSTEIEEMIRVQNPDFGLRKRRTTLKTVPLSMSDDDEDLSAFLKGFGFAEMELNVVIDELNSYRSIPGTTIGRYMNRVINSLEEEERAAFLKGLMVGMVVRKAVDASEETDLTEKGRKGFRRDQEDDTSLNAEKLLGWGEE